MRLFEDAGIETTGAARVPHPRAAGPGAALICIGPMQGKQQTFVLLDDWAPRAAARELVARGGARRARGALRREPRAGDRSGFRALGGHHRRRRAAGPARRRTASRRARFAGAEHWLAADAGRWRGAAARRAGAAYLLAGFDEYLLGYKDRDAMLDPEHAGKIAPGRQRRLPADDRRGRADRRHVGAIAARRRADDRAAAVRGGRPELAARVKPEAARYREFLGLPADAQPRRASEAPGA